MLHMQYLLSSVQCILSFIIFLQSSGAEKLSHFPILLPNMFDFINFGPDLKVGKGSGLKWAIWNRHLKI